MLEFDQDIEAAFPVKANRRCCFLAPCTCGHPTEKMVSIHFFIILVASLQSFSVFLFAGTPRDENGILSASIGCALSLLPLPFLLFALYGIVYNRPNLILVLVVFLLLVLPHFAFVLILLSTLHSIHAIRVMLRQRIEMIERNRAEKRIEKKMEKKREVKERGQTEGMRLEKVTTGGREMFIYTQ